MPKYFKNRNLSGYKKYLPAWHSIQLGFHNIFLGQAYIHTYRYASFSFSKKYLKFQLSISFSLPYCQPSPSHVLSLDTSLVFWVLLLKLVISFSLIIFISKFINMWIQPAESAQCCLCICDFRADYLLLNTKYKLISRQDWFSLSVINCL